MGLLDRMGRTISANFNALLDGAEDPRKSIEQTLRDMEEQIRAARQEVVHGVAAEKQLRRKIEALDQEAQKWGRRAELAVTRQDDQLAREALLQKRRVVGDRDRAEALRVQQRGRALEMKAELERMERKLEEFKAAKSTIVARAEQANTGTGVEALGARGPGGAFAEFRRMEDQIEGVEAATEAQREVEQLLAKRGPSGMSPDQLEARFLALEGQAGSPSPEAPASEVDDELAAIKRRIRIGT